jgi:hypothetical protein
MGEFGIEALKSAGLDLAKFGMKLEQSTNVEGPGGKKITLPEGVGLAIFAVPKALEHINNRAVIRQELADLDTEEREEWITYIVEELDLINDRVELLIEKVLIALDAIADVIDEAKGAKVE